MAARFSTWLSTNKLLIEVVLIIIGFGAYTYWRFDPQLGSLALRAAVALLAIFYYATARQKSDVADKYGMIASKVVGLSSMLALVGILLATLGSILGIRITFIAAFSLAIAVVILTVRWMRTREPAIPPYVLRGLLWGFLSGWVYWNGS